METAALLDIVSLVLPLFGLIVLGFIAGRVQELPLAALGWLNTFIIYLALPALFFALVARTPVEKLASWDFILINIGVTFVVFVAAVLIGLLESRGRLDEATIQGLAAAYGNIGYMGAALSILALGSAAAAPVALIICFENTMHFVLAPALMAVARPGRGLGQVLLGIVKRIAFNPFIMATVAGVAVAVTGVEVPSALDRLLAYLSQAAAPCALFAMGVTLALSPLKRFPLALGYIVPLKLVVHPALMYVALSQIPDLDPVWLFTAVLLAALPTATNVFVIAQQYDAWINRASAAVVVTTAVSIVTVTALLYAITTGQIAPSPYSNFTFAPNFPTFGPVGR